MTGALMGALAVLALAAGVAARRRVARRGRGTAGGSGQGLSDHDLRQIEERGFLARDEDEPLDAETIEEEERRFWSSEAWDRAEEYGA